MIKFTLENDIDHTLSRKFAGIVSPETIFIKLKQQSAIIFIYFKQRMKMSIIFAQ